MKKISKLLLFFTIFILMIGSVKLAGAQCAQCAATVESSAKNGDTTAFGLNKGILFLLAAPYLAVAAVGFIWYKKFRRKNVAIDMRNEKLHLN